MKNLPTIFQLNVLWSAITALSLTVIGGIAIGLIYLGTRVISFLQPILIPFAVAGVLAYLLDPAVRWIERRGLSRQKAVLLVFAVFVLCVTGLGLWMGPKLGEQSGRFGDKFGVYFQKARTNVVQWAGDLETRFGVTLLPHAPAAPATEPVPDAQEGSDIKEEKEAAGDIDFQAFLSGDWVRTSLPAVLKNGWGIVTSSVGGFMGVFGFLLSFVIVPLYLFYFLIESAKIKATWADYLPLRASAFKDEVVSCLTEINGYLVAFFRGQLFVSLINGVATGTGLAVVGLDLGLLIGLMLCIVGIIPYLGIVLCWIPAVIIAATQGGSMLIPADWPWWGFPLVVTGIFAIVQQVDGLFITPKIVGESVGLHPMTVIVSVFAWALILGGLLGAILAVPLTASLKVLFQRYVWRARLAPQTIGGATTRIVTAESQPQNASS